MATGRKIEIGRSWREAFLISVAMLLTLTAAAKLISVFGNAGILDRSNPLFGFISNRGILFVAAGLELGVAGWITLGAAAFRPKLEVVLWLGMTFLAYRLALWVVGYEGDCSCLGTVAGGVGLSSEAAKWLMRGLLAYILMPSLVCWWFERQQAPAGEELGLSEAKE